MGYYEKFSDLKSWVRKEREAADERIRASSQDFEAIYRQAIDVCREFTHALGSNHYRVNTKGGEIHIEYFEDDPSSSGETTKWICDIRILADHIQVGYRKIPRDPFSKEALADALVNQTKSILLYERFPL